MSKSEEIKEIIEVLENLEQFTSNTPRERLNSAIQHFQDYLRIAESGMPKKKELNTGKNNYGGLFGEALTTANRDISIRNQALHECILFIQHNFRVERLESIIRKTKYIGMVKHYEICSDWAKSIAQALHKEMMGEH